MEKHWLNILGQLKPREPYRRVCAYCVLTVNAKLETICKYRAKSSKKYPSWRDTIIGYIYVIENKINHKKYVGQTIDPKNRWKAHKNDDMKNPKCLIGLAFKKYGIENFSFSVIEECENENMSEREIYWIKKLNTCVKEKDSWGYNFTHGGECLYGEENPFYGKTHSAETRHVLSEKAKQRIGELNPFFGRQHTEESKKKIAKANNGRKWTTEMRKLRSENQKGDKNPFYGKRHSDETKQKIREYRIGRVPSTAIKWIAFNSNEELLFLSIGKIMEWLKQTRKINNDEHFTMSMLKTRLKNSENKKILFMGYYWKKSVETIENVA